MAKKRKILVKGLEIVTIEKGVNDYISLTDMAKYKSYDSGVVISNWLSTKYTIQFIGTWEKVYNPNFNLMEFNKIKLSGNSTNEVTFRSSPFEKTNFIYMIQDHVKLTPITRVEKISK